MGLSRKAASTTADEAYIPINLVKRRQYWDDSHPQGVADIDPKDIINVDEMELEIEQQNWSFRKTAV